MMGTSNMICITPFPSELLSNEGFKKELSDLFTSYGDVKQLICLPSFQRVLVEFQAPSQTHDAQISLDQSIIYGQTVQCYFIDSAQEHSFLEVPENDKTFLISPPASPPLGWEQTIEDEPVKDPHGHLEVDDVILALERHALYEELHQGCTDETGGIIIFTPNGDLPIIKVENFDGEEIETGEKGGLIARTRIPSR